MAKRVLGPALALVVLAVTTGCDPKPVDPDARVFTQRSSVASGGLQSVQGGSTQPAMSSDGRLVAFTSFASDLVDGDTNDTPDVFLHDRARNHTRRMSLTTSDAQVSGSSTEPAVNADASVVAFTSDGAFGPTSAADQGSQIFVRDRALGTTSLISIGRGRTPANGASFSPAVSADGRFVTFSSVATNLVAADTGPSPDVLVHDRQTRTTELVSATRTGRPGNDASNAPSISADGRLIAFTTLASDLAGGGDDVADVVVRDRSLKTTTLVSTALGGAQPDGGSIEAALSANGTTVAFSSYATNLVVTDTNESTPDIFVQDLASRRTTLVSRTRRGQGQALSRAPTISADGTRIAYLTPSALERADTNGVTDVYQHDSRRRFTHRVSVGESPDRRVAEGVQAPPATSADGWVVAFDHLAPLVDDDTNRRYDVFVRDLTAYCGCRNYDCT